MDKEIKYCTDLIEALQEYVKENGNDRVLVDFQTKTSFGNDTVSRLLQIPDDDLSDTGYFCYIVCKRADYEGRSF